MFVFVAESASVNAKDTKKVETQPSMPKEWKDAICDHAPDVRLCRLSWKTSNSSHAWTPVCDDVEVSVTDTFDRSGRKVYAMDVGHGPDGFLGPQQLAEDLWSRCWGVYLGERDARGGSLSAIVCELEVLDQHRNVLATVAKGVRPEYRDDGVVSHTWIEDTETPEERRDRSLLAEMRRRDHHYNGLIKQQADTIVALSATVVQVHAASMDAREQLIRERELDMRQRAEDYGSDRNAERMWDVIDRVVAKKMQADGIGGADGPDPLVVRSIAVLDAMTDEAWGKLAALSDSFLDLRSALESARLDDVTREGLYAALDVVRVTIANEEHDQMAVLSCLPGPAVVAVQALWKELGDP